MTNITDMDAIENFKKDNLEKKEVKPQAELSEERKRIEAKLQEIKESLLNTKNN